MCSLQIWSIYAKWKENPVIVSCEQKFTTIGQIPFPAVTICGRFTMGNESSLDYGAVLEKIINGETVDSNILDLFELASGACFKRVSSELRKNITNVFYDERSRDFQLILSKMFNSNVDDLVAKHHGIATRRSWLDKKILTKHGICLTFNMLAHEMFVKQDV